MILDLKKIFSEEGSSSSFDYEMDLSSNDFNGSYPFVTPVSVKGMVENQTGTAKFSVDVIFTFLIPCDRCTKIFEKRYAYSFSHILVLSLQDEENDDYIQVKNDKLDVDELVRADILLELPVKFLCGENCKGLCSVCGKDLNDGPCGCEKHQTDPRLEALRNLIN